ncbi:DNA recombination protein RecO [Novosphingobium sp. FSY-8]|uniref:DNA recombination protein RecO n=1 Tax=Novosphingobium ovatum TaxID=1908523 RepID=A0ABW9X9E8_9SPHN|nr:recombination protein O N-terminal domain-containing protein [Novosphingobium ovatum]NBC35161.1 DNA recombination protein RecO [Novosphingobium ovatum]
MHIRASALVCAARPHGEVGVIVRLLTERYGMVAAYVSGGRGREMRPVLIPGNGVEAEMRARTPAQMPSARIELTHSRAPFLTEPLPAVAIGWATTLAASALPERHAYPAIHAALEALLDAVCHAPSARGWAGAMLAYEALVLRELGYGNVFGAGVDGQRLLALGQGGDWPRILDAFDRLGVALSRYVLAEAHGDVMGARIRLCERLRRIAAP